MSISNTGLGSVVAAERLLGTIARPNGVSAMQKDEPPTSGIEDIIDWSDLEELLDEDAFGSKREVREWLDTLFTAAGVAYTRSVHDEVKAGMFPEYRVLYDALPNGTDPAVNGRLSPAQVIEIRRRHADGEKALHLADEYGVRHNTVSDIIHFKTWKQVDAA